MNRDSCGEEDRNEAETSEDVTTGSAIPVWKVVNLHKKGYSIKKIRDEFPELTEKLVRRAISSYYCNRRRIERQIDEHEGS